MPNQKQNCQILYQKARYLNFDEQKVSLTRGLGVDPEAARDRVCLCFAQVLASLVVQVRLEEKAVGCLNN